MAWVKRMGGEPGLLAQRVAGALMFGAFLAVWQRALDAVAGRTVYSLLAFGVAVAAGVACGCALAWRPCRRMRQPQGVLIAVLALAACWLVIQPAILGGVIAGWQHVLTDAKRTFGSYLTVLGETAAIFVAVPSVLAGIALRMALLPGQPSQVAAARTALEAVVSAAVGYAFAAAVVEELGLGVEAFTRVAALWYAALASVSVVACGGRRTLGRVVLACMPCALVAGLWVALNPGNGVAVLYDGLFGRLVHRDSGFAFGKPVFACHTRGHSLVAYADPDYQFVVALDGRPVLFGNRFHTARTLTGYVPLLVRPGCKRAAVLGPEAGLYLPFFARAGVADLRYAEADPVAVKVLVAADAYLSGDSACEAAVLRRDVSLSASAAYDILFLAPEPSWTRGTQASYSRARFARCRQALSKDGIVALHVDARALSAGRFAAVAGDFAAVFPDMQVWCAGASDWVLVGGTKAVKTPADGMLALFERTSVFRDFVRAGGLALPEALACLVCDGAGLAPWLARTRPESAWGSEWSGPRSFFEQAPYAMQPVALEGCRQWKSQWVLPGETDADVFRALSDKTARTVGGRASAVMALAEMRGGRGEVGLDAVREAAKLSPHDALLTHLAESLELEGRRRIKIGDLKGALKCYENLLSFSTGTARSHYGMGFCLRGNGDKEGAYLHFARAVAYAPEQTDYRLEMAQSALAVGEFVEADRQYQEALKRGPDNPAALILAAKAMVWQGRPQKDTAQAVKLAERACKLTEWKDRDCALALADIYIEAGRVLEGMGLKRRLKEGAINKPSVSP